MSSDVYRLTDPSDSTGITEEQKPTPENGRGNGGQGSLLRYNLKGRQIPQDNWQLLYPPNHLPTMPRTIGTTIECMSTQSKHFVVQRNISTNCYRTVL